MKMISAASKSLKALSVFLLILLGTVSCVHQFPEEYDEPMKFILHLDFDTEMSLHKEITYTRGSDSATKDAESQHDVRYKINAYRMDNRRSDNRVADATFSFTKSDIAELDYSAELELYEGTYTFHVWADYVDHENAADKYYDTRDFSEIILADRENHSGSNDFREAFRGIATAEVTHKGDNQLTVGMNRPMGKFKFISTDKEFLLDHVTQKLKEQGKLMSMDYSPDSKSDLLQSIELAGFSITFRYNVFMPCSFNMFTDRPADSWTGMTFQSSMQVENDNELCLGYDYIFVNGSETTLSITVEVHDRSGELISSSNPIDVPIVRNKLTLVKGNFLTSKASGGVTINPGYEGDDYNIEIH